MNKGWESVGKEDSGKIVTTGLLAEVNTVIGSDSVFTSQCHRSTLHLEEIAVLVHITDHVLETIDNVNSLPATR